MQATGKATTTRRAIPRHKGTAAMDTPDAALIAAHDAYFRAATAQVRLARDASDDEMATLCDDEREAVERAVTIPATTPAGLHAKAEMMRNLMPGDADVLRVAGGAAA